MNFGINNATVRIAEGGDAFHFAPLTASIGGIELLADLDARPSGNDLTISDFRDIVKIGARHVLPFTLRIIGYFSVFATLLSTEQRRCGLQPHGFSIERTATSRTCNSTM